MILVCFPVIPIELRQPLVLHDQYVLRVAFLGGFGEVETAGDDRIAVDHHYFVVGDGVGGIDGHRDARVFQVGGSCVLLATLTLVQDRLDLHAPVMGLLQRLRDGGGRETVRLHQDSGLGRADSLHNGVLPSALGREVYLRRYVFENKVRSLGRHCAK